MTFTTAARRLLSHASMRRPSIAFAPLLLLAVPTIAAAQAVGPGAVPVEAVPAAPIGPGAVPVIVPTGPAPLLGLDARADDPAVDRAYAAPSALIAPGGSTTFTLRAPVGPLINAKLSHAFTDRVELGVGTILIEDEETNVMSLHGKVQLWRSARAALAGSVDYYFSTDENDEGGLLVPSLVASFCAGGAECATLISLHLTAIAVPSEEEMPVLPGLSIVSGRRTQLVAEAHVFNDEQSGDSAIVGYGGVRFRTGRFAFEGGLGFFADTSEDTYYATDDCFDCGSYEDTSEPEVLPWPFVGMSARL